MIINPITVTFARHELEAIADVLAKITIKRHNATLEFAEDRIAGALKRARADAQLATLEGV